MDTHNKSSEQKLYEDGLQLLSNGQRMTYVFKYVRDKAGEDVEMRKRVMERLTSNNEVKKINESRLEAHSEPYKMSTWELIGGIGVIAFAAYMIRVLWDSGWVSTLPFGLIIFVFIMWTKKR